MNPCEFESRLTRHESLYDHPRERREGGRSWVVSLTVRGDAGELAVHEGLEVSEGLGPAHPAPVDEEDRGPGDAEMLRLHAVARQDLGEGGVVEVALEAGHAELERAGVLDQRLATPYRAKTQPTSTQPAGSSEAIR